MDPYAATSAPLAGRADGATGRSWSDAEPRLGAAIRRATARLLKRSRASWPIWTVLVALTCAGIAAWRIRHPPPFATTLAFRITEGAVPVAPESLSSRALRAYIYDLALSRHNLTPLASNEGGGTKGKKIDIDDAITDILDATSLHIGESDFVEDRTPGDPPRSVRIELTFRAATADRSWAMAHALADLMVTSERNRRSRIVERQTAESDAASKRAGPALGGVTAPAPGDLAALRAARETELRDSAQAWLARRSLEGNQGLRFELADPGRPPADPSPDPWSRGIALLLALPLLLFGAALLAGAADPRVLDAEDLTAMGIVVLGRVPPPTARV